jgi:hypothetical protein
VSVRVASWFLILCSGEVMNFNADSLFRLALPGERRHDSGSLVAAGADASVLQSQLALLDVAEFEGLL